MTASLHVRAALSLVVLGSLWTSLSGCAPMTPEEDSTSSDLSRVPDAVRVNGRSYDVETEYLPRVVQCENPGAPAESLRAQAVAARTYLTYRTRGQRTPTIGDGQQDQVFTCPSNQNGRYVSQDVINAVHATRGQVVLHGGQIIAGFFVAGATRNSACSRGSDPTNTERFVTVNVGRTGSTVRPSSIGTRTDPANRGAMGQNLANCLATRDRLTGPQLLAYFYGADIEVRGLGPVPGVPLPSEGDPAVAPDTTDSTTDPTTDPTADPTPDPAQPTPQQAACWSYTLQRWAADGECVQSAADRAWYQCVNMIGWQSGVDVSTGMGPGGACTTVNAL